MKEGKTAGLSGAIFEEDFGRILRNIAEDLKLPLTRIATIHEATSQQPSEDPITINARAAIQLIDSYILGSQAFNGRQQLALEPVSLQAVAQDSVQYMQRFARSNGCLVKLKTSKRLGLVMANRQALQSAITALMYSFITLTGQAKQKKPTIMLIVARDGSKARLSIKSNSGLQLASLASTQKLHGRARQPLTAIPFGSSAGVVLAKTLLEAMGSKLTYTQATHSSGYSTLLLPSHQLALL